MTLDDSGDTTGRTVTLTSKSQVQTCTVSGMSPAPITYLYGANLIIEGGSGGNTFTVINTGNFYTFLQTGTGNDTVNVQATTISLYIDNSGGSDSQRSFNTRAFSGLMGVRNARQRTRHRFLEERALSRSTI